MKEISPEILRKSHRLSSRQVNSIYGDVVFPEAIEDRIKEFEIVKEFLLVYDLLNAGNIRFIALKGPVLSFRLYGDATSRNFNDLDILVEENDIVGTKKILEEKGYTASSIEWPEKEINQEKIIRHINHFSVSNFEKGIVIEIHWRLLRTPAISFSAFKSLVSANLTIVNFAGRSIMVLNNELELLYLIIHGGLHFWMRLKWLLDVDLFLKTQKIDWNRFAKLAEDLKASRMVALCREIHKEYFPEGPHLSSAGSAPDSLIEYSRKRIRDEKKSDEGSLKWVLCNFWYTLIVFPGLRYKVREVSNLLFMSYYSGRIRSLINRRFILA